MPFRGGARINNTPAIATSTFHVLGYVRQWGPTESSAKLFFQANGRFQLKSTSVPKSDNSEIEIESYSIAYVTISDYGLCRADCNEAEKLC